MLLRESDEGYLPSVSGRRNRNAHSRCSHSTCCSRQRDRSAVHDGIVVDPQEAVGIGEALVVRRASVEEEVPHELLSARAWHHVVLLKGELDVHCTFACHLL